MPTADDSVEGLNPPRWKVWTVSFAVGFFGVLAVLIIVGAAYVIWYTYFADVPHYPDAS